MRMGISSMGIMSPAVHAQRCYDTLCLHNVLLACKTRGGGYQPCQEP